MTKGSTVRATNQPRAKDRSTRILAKVSPKARRAATVMAVLTAAGAALSADPLVTLAVGATATTLLLLSWRPGDLPILLLPLGLQFAQVAAKPLHAIFLQVPLQSLSSYGGDLRSAAFLGLGALCALAFGMHLAVDSLDERGIRRKLRLASPRIAFALCVVAIVLGAAARNWSYSTGAARQIVGSVWAVKYAGIFLLAFTCFRLRRGHSYLLSIAAYEIVFGLTGYFSGFKEALLTIGTAFICARPRLDSAGTLRLGTISLITIVVSLFWTSTKSEYRSFLNRGTGAQVVLQPLDERFEFLHTQVAEVTIGDLETAIPDLIGRVSYIDFLSRVMQQVPASTPHQNGAMIGAAFAHVARPRIFFPDKPALPSDTEITSRFTGLPIYRGANVENTSISIGYVGDLYIDFGVGGALAGGFVLGALFGYVYRATISYGGMPALINYSLAMSLMLTVSAQFERTLTKTFAATLMTFAVLLAIQRLVLPGILRTSALLSREFGLGLRRRSRWPRTAISSRRFEETHVSG